MRFYCLLPHSAKLSSSLLRVTRVRGSYDRSGSGEYRHTSAKCCYMSIEKAYNEEKTADYHNFLYLGGPQTVSNTISFTNSCLLRILDTIVHRQLRAKSTAPFLNGCKDISNLKQHDCEKRCFVANTAIKPISLSRSQYLDLFIAA